MKRKKNKALKKKVFDYTDWVAKHKIFHLPKPLKKIVGLLCVMIAMTIVMFPLYSLILLSVGALFLKGPLYTKKKVLRVTHEIRYIQLLLYRKFPYIVVIKKFILSHIYPIICVLLLCIALYTQYQIPLPGAVAHSQYQTRSQRSDTIASYCDESLDPCTFVPLQQQWANWLWLQMIQYVGYDIYSDNYPELHDRLNDIALLHNTRQYPYIFGQYLLPINRAYTEKEAAQQALRLGEKGLSAICDTNMIESISSLSDQDFLDMYYGQDKVVPCQQYLLPQSIGFVAFYYAKDIQKAINYYRVAALAPDAPDTLVNMPAIITARYDDDRKSMMMWQDRYQSAQYQLNPELNDDDLFFLLASMEYALAKAVHHAFVSLIQQVATLYHCDTSIDCVQNNSAATIQYYKNQCDADDVVSATLCQLLRYAQEQGRLLAQSIFVYPIDPDTPEYGRRPDLQRRDSMPTDI